MHMASKEDIWDTKNWFRNEVSRIITKENLRCRSMLELENSVLIKVKQWMNKEEPKPGFVDGPWQTYVKRLHIKNEINEKDGITKKFKLIDAASLVPSLKFPEKENMSQSIFINNIELTEEEEKTEITSDEN